MARIRNPVCWFRKIEGFVKLYGGISMLSRRARLSRLVLSGVTIVIIGYFAILATPAAAQGSQGNNDVFSSSGGQVGSTAFIDASTFVGPPNNFCGVLNGILSSPNFPPGAVIDARGLPGNNGTSMTCTGTPWSGITNPPPSTILLPAGSITIPSTWVLPNGTRVIGEGSTNPYATITAVFQTTIQASSSLTGAMIQFCSSVCAGVTLEDVTLIGNTQAINGIVNSNAQELSYAKNVAMYQVLGTGLKIFGSAQHSGPYSNITYDTGNSGIFGSTCASIAISSTAVPGGTRGIHGLTCISDNNSQTAITLDSSNNSLEDIRIVGFNQGVLVGSLAAAKNNVLKNVWGDTIQLRGLPSPPTVVEISTNNVVTDLVITGVANPMSGTNTIWDRATSTTLTDSAIAMYALGEPSTGNGYSRFTTSPNAATWIVGNNAPPSSGSNCAKGSLYSCIGGSTNCSWPNLQPAALWACTSSGWASIQ
jgi:hypothetical protein